MPKVFQPSGNTVTDIPADKRFVNLYIDGDGMFEVLLPSTEYAVNQAHETHSRLRHKM